MGKLTQQKYDLTCALMKAGLEIHSGNEHLLFAAVDAYAVARESREIAELKAQVEGLKTDMQHSRLIEAAQVKESNELNAEIKRLRGAISELWNRDAISLEEMRQILSPAPVTEGPQPLSIDEMLEYCIKWCEELKLCNWQKISIAENIKVSLRFPLSAFQNKWWEISVRFSAVKINVTQGMKSGDIIYAYSIIRTIERGEIPKNQD